MTRNWGLTEKPPTLRAASNERPAATLAVSATFGIAAAAIAALAFSDAAGRQDGMFRGGSLAFAVIAAGFGCWLYILVAWRRFAANFTARDGFSTLLVFYSKAAAGLVVAAGVSAALGHITPPGLSGAIACLVGGAAAAATLQTVIAFVPGAPVEPHR